MADQPYSVPFSSGKLSSYGKANVQVSGECDCGARINYRNGISGNGSRSDCRHMEARCKQIKARSISLSPKSTNRSVPRACLRSDQAGAHNAVFLVEFIPSLLLVMTLPEIRLAENLLHYVMVRSSTASVTDVNLPTSLTCMSMSAKPKLIIPNQR
jgi:hypothetical protein